jgi:serine/threonine protein kinase
MKKNDKQYPGIYLSSDENVSLLSPSSSSSSSSPSPHKISIENVTVKNKNSANININDSQEEKNMKANPPSPIFTVDEIVNFIIKCVKEAELYNLTYWDDMSKFMLKYTISNIHKRCEKEYIKDLIVYKQYDVPASEKKPNIIKYGVFKHKCFNLMFRIDCVDDQFSGEDIVSSALMHKYRNKYQDIIRLGIVIPVYCHIKLSNPQLFYSVQPWITNSMTLDKWIEYIKHKGNFEEIVYDAFIQLSSILKELHEVNCVHGDIKPANILIVQKQTQVCVFLIDFGLSGIHEKTNNATGGTLPFCAPETYNTNANTRNGNNVIKYPQHFEYNWLKHNKSHDIWSLGFIFMTVYIFKHINLYYHEYPSDFFLPSGYVSPNYLRMVKHEYIRDMFIEHILVEPSKRCDILKLNDIISNLSFM